MKQEKKKITKEQLDDYIAKVETWLLGLKTMSDQMTAESSENPPPPPPPPPR
jgi:hypothetical protein